MGNLISILANATTPQADVAKTFRPWNKLPAHLQQHVIGQLALSDAARAAVACRDIYTYAKEDPRWRSLVSPFCAPRSAYRRASEGLNRAVVGPQTRTVLTASPLRNVSQACAYSHAYFTATLSDWQKQEESLGNYRAVEVVDKIIRTRRIKQSWLDLSGIPMRTLPESLGQLNSLQELYLRGCTGLTDLPKSLRQLKTLQTLDLSGCTSLTALPESIGQLNTLQTLYLKRCTGLAALPDSIEPFNTLRWLSFSECTGLTALPESIGQLNTLQWLNLSGCTGLTALPESIGQLNALQDLYLSGCTSLTALPESIGQLNALQTLLLYDCTGLTALPESIGQLNALQRLYLSGCANLTALPESIGHLNALEKLFRGLTSLSPTTETLLKNRGCFIRY